MENKEKDFNLKSENLDINMPNTATQTVLDNTVKNKLFKSGDILVYSFILLLLIGLFFIFIFPTLLTDNNHTGFKVYKNDQLVLEFSTSNDNLFIVSDSFNNLVEINGSEKNKHCFNITIYTSSKKTGYNTIEIDTVSLTAKVINSTCSTSKDCVYSPAISSSGSIYCAPHGLKIIPNNFDGLVPPVAG